MNYKKIKIIEKSKLDLCEKVELLLVYANQKPATEFMIGNFGILDLDDNSSKFNLSKLRLESQTYIRLLEKLGLKYNIQEVKTSDVLLKEGINSKGKILLRRIKFKNPHIIIYLSRYENLKDQLQHAFESGDSVMLGKLYGFPETAIQAYHGQRSPFMGCLDNGVPLDYFTNFVFSKDYFKEELESTSQRWHDTVKRLSPKIYKEIEQRTKRLYNPKDNFRIAWRD